MLAIRGQRVLLDTNVIMKVEKSPSPRVQRSLLAFAAHNEVCICDTVLYELLRNMNAKRFRERHAHIRRAGADAAALGEVGQHGAGLVAGQVAVEQRRALAFGEAGLTGAAVQEAAAAVGSV